MLWITFKSCIFAFWNNYGWQRCLASVVVNYIQILYLCILKQLFRRALRHLRSCELHSNLVSLHSETTFKWSPCNVRGLWITFKSCIFAFWNNRNDWVPYLHLVVNYIQILYLCILKQPDNAEVEEVKSCELHSNLVSLHSETTRTIPTIAPLLLWITFKSCIFAFWNNINAVSPIDNKLWITFKSCIFAFWNN